MIKKFDTKTLQEKGLVVGCDSKINVITEAEHLVEKTFDEPKENDQ